MGRVFRIALCTLGAALLLGILLWQNRTSPTLPAVNGYIDACGVLPEKGPYMLSGVWYRKATGDAAAEWEPYGDMRYNRKMRGYTYSFALAVSPDFDFFFMLPRPFTSKLWINGVAVKNGEPITSADIFRLSDYGTDTSLDTADVYDILLEANSTSYYDGYQGLLLGSANALQTAQTRWMYLDIVAVGLHAMLVLYSVVMFAQKRSETYLLLLALAASADILHFLSIPRYPAISVILALPSPVMRQFYALNYFVCRQFVPKPPKWIDYTVYISIATSILAQFVLPSYGMTVLRYAGYIQMLLQLYMILHAIWKRIPYSTTLLVGWYISFMVESVFYVIINNGIVPQGVVDVQIMPAEYAQFTYIVAFAIAATGKFAYKFSQADELASSLELKVVSQTRELRIANERLVTEQNRRQQFMTDIVHNIRSPLFALGGYIDLLKDAQRQPTDKEKDYLARIDAKLIFLEKMVNEMFLFVRLEDKRIEFCSAEFSMVSMLDNAKADALVKGEDKELTIHVTCTPQELICVGDEFRLKQVMDILLDNAVRHSPSGASIKINGNLENNAIIVTVSDEGPGIEQDEMSNMFQRYERGKGGSVGLGLSIAKYIVEYHGGIIFVQNGAIGGCTFTITLPI